MAKKKKCPCAPDCKDEPVVMLDVKLPNDGIGFETHRVCLKKAKQFVDDLVTQFAESK